MLLKDSVAAKKAAKAQKPATVEVTTDAPKDPAWDVVRDTTRQMAAHGRMFLRCQVRLGMLFSNLKKAHGYREGRPAKNSAESAEFLPWEKLVERESGYSRRSADIFIQLYEASVKKLKTGKKLDLPAEAKRQALTLFKADCALTLTEEQWETVDSVIGSLTDGETQQSLMRHLKLIPTPAPMPKPPGKSEPDPDQPTAGQLAFHFFGAVASPLINARSNPDYKKLLMALPVDSSEESPLSLSTLASEARAFLADIEEITTANLKAARGRTVQ
jgi:hypothetical protein